MTEKQLAMIRIEPDEPSLPPEMSLGDRFAGALKVSDERYEEMQRELQRGRDEWEQRAVF